MNFCFLNSKNAHAIHKRIDTPYAYIESCLITTYLIVEDKCNSLYIWRAKWPNVFISPVQNRVWLSEFPLLRILHAGIYWPVVQHSSLCAAYGAGHVFLPSFLQNMQESPQLCHWSRQNDLILKLTVHIIKVTIPISQYLPRSHETLQ